MQDSYVKDTLTLIAKKFNLPEKLVREIVTSQFEYVKAIIALGGLEKIFLAGLGSFRVKRKMRWTLENTDKFIIYADVEPELCRISDTGTYKKEKKARKIQVRNIERKYKSSRRKSSKERTNLEIDLPDLYDL